jgi:hypothetical protein
VGRATNDSTTPTNQGEDQGQDQGEEGNKKEQMAFLASQKASAKCGANVKVAIRQLMSLDSPGFSFNVGATQAPYYFSFIARAAFGPQDLDISPKKPVFIPLHFLLS